MAFMAIRRTLLKFSLPAASAGKGAFLIDWCYVENQRVEQSTAGEQSYLVGVGLWTCR